MPHYKSRAAYFSCAVRDFRIFARHDFKYHIPGIDSAIQTRRHGGHTLIHSAPIMPRASFLHDDIVSSMGALLLFATLRHFPRYGLQ